MEGGSSGFTVFRSIAAITLAPARRAEAISSPEYRAVHAAEPHQKRIDVRRYALTSEAGSA